MKSDISLAELLSHIRPEDGLLLCCIRACSQVERAQHINVLIRKGIDWPYLVEASTRHGLLPRLYRTLEGACSDEIPGHCRDHLKELFLKNTLLNLSMTRELLSLLEIFKAEGIEAIPFKGPVLSVLLYGDVSLRQFVDLDLFVRKNDVARVKEILLTLGYSPEFELTQKQERVYLETKDEYNFYSQKTNTMVEVHWVLVPRFYSISFRTGDLYDHLRPLSLSGREVLTFSPEDLVLILSVHGAKHGWVQLQWICDLGGLIEREREIDWGNVLRRAGGYGIERNLLLSLFVVKDLTGVELPGEVLQKMGADTVIKGLAGRIYGNLFPGVRAENGFFRDHSFQIKMKKDWLEKVRYCLDLSLTPTVGDWESVSFPDFLFPLYYVTRPFRLAAKYGPGLFRRALNR